MIHQPGTWRAPLLLLLLVSGLLQSCNQPEIVANHKSSPVLDPETFRHHVDYFNAMIDEGVVNHIPNQASWSWMQANIPFFDCPDQQIQEIYYYRWWVLRKHLKKTEDGYIFTEFIRPVGHSTRHNAISCALGHHINEARWLHNQQYLDDYVQFWLQSGENGGLEPEFHNYSGWVSDALYQRYLVNRDQAALVDLLDALLLDYEAWQKENQLESGLFWQYDVRDGMEESVSGSRTAKNARPTINSYMWANAAALARIATLAGKPGLAETYRIKAEKLKTLVQSLLWDAEAEFFKPLMEETGRLADVREQIGFTPWYFDLPDPGYENAWKQLIDPEGFQAPFGPTTAEQRHPGFVIAYEGDDCQWNGPSWPFSTTVTLRALANLLNNYDQSVLTKKDYLNTFRTYTKSHRRKLEDGQSIPWIDENLNPFTGEWHARRLKIDSGRFDGRGDHYNHSGYGDLIITGLVGLRPREDDRVEVNPLLPDGTWDWFCLDNVLYHGRILTVLWDRTGERYGRGKGFQILVDGSPIAQSDGLGRLVGELD